MLTLSKTKKALLLMSSFGLVISILSAIVVPSAIVKAAPYCDRETNPNQYETCIRNYTNAEITRSCGDGDRVNTGYLNCSKRISDAISSGDYDYDGTPDSETGQQGNPAGDCIGTALSKENCGIIYYLVLLINVLSGLVGIVIVIMITVGGIQYSTARDNPQAAVAAKTRITNAVMALVFFLFIYAFLQYVVPGGVL